MIFETKVAGIPCQCEVLFYSPYVPMTTYNSWGDAHAPEGPEFDFRILDRRGRPAPWLDKKVNDQIEADLYEEFRMACTAERHGIEY